LNGFLLDPGDVEGIASKTLSLIQSPLPLSSWETLNTQLLVEFDIESMVHQQEMLYEDLLAERIFFGNGCSSSG
jgi:hypothetical protein